MAAHELALKTRLQRLDHRIDTHSSTPSHRLSVNPWGCEAKDWESCRIAERPQTSKELDFHGAPKAEGGARGCEKFPKEHVLNSKKNFPEIQNARRGYSTKRDPRSITGHLEIKSF